MKTLSVLISTILLLSGCAIHQCNPFKCEPKTITTIQTVKIPVPVKAPQPPTLTWPFLPITKLVPTSTDKETAEAYQETVLLLINAVKERDLVIDKYRD